MTYAQYGLIQASDFNNLVNNFNAIYGSGSGNSGYGQTTLGQVTAGNKVSYADWATLIDKISRVALHQNTSITATIAPTTGDPVKFVSAIGTNITALTNNRLSASAQSTTSTTSKSTTTTWLDKATFTSTVSFSSGAAARYFFNSGGQIAITASHGSSGSTGIDKLFYDISNALGTVTLSGGSGTIAGTAFTGTTKTGGAGTVNVDYTISTATGYFALSTTDVEIFRQTAVGALSKYVTSYVSIKARIDATGGVIIFTTTFDENWSSGVGLTVSTGTRLNVAIKSPSTTYLSNTWGTPSVSSSYV